MAKEKKAKEKKDIEVVIIPDTKVDDTPVITKGIINEPEYEVPPGYYHMVRIDADGNEIAGSDFALHPNTYERGGYGKLTGQFKIKKKQRG